MTQLNNQAFNILIVDDVIDNIELAMTILKEEGYHLFYALNGKQALQLVESDPEKFDFILLDVMMPDIDGLEVCARLKANEQTKDIPIMFVTALNNSKSISKGFKLGGIDYITKPFHHIELLVKVKNHLSLSQAKHLLTQHNISLEKKLSDSYRQYLKELQETQHELIMMLLTFLEASSSENGSHVTRISQLSATLARHHPELSHEDENILYHAAPLHDIGNLALPHEILYHKGSLTPEQHSIMKTHTTIGHKMLSQSTQQFFVKAAIIAHEHHENWDGTGYPRNLAGHQIDIYARVVTIADVLDALTHARSYRRAWSFDEALNYIEELKGIKFDPALVNILIANQNEFRDILEL